MDRARATQEGSSGLSANDLSNLLWRERETLERLLYALTVERLIATSGDARWITTADEEVRLAVAAMHDRELLRSAEVEVLARSLGVPGTSTLAQLAELAPEPWVTIFTEHRAAMQQLVTEIDHVVAESRRLLQAGADAARDALDRIESTVTSTTTYNSRGMVGAGTSRGRSILDEHA